MRLPRRARKWKPQRRYGILFPRRDDFDNQNAWHNIERSLMKLGLGAVVLTMMAALAGCASAGRVPGSTDASTDEPMELDAEIAPGQTLVAESSVILSLLVNLEGRVKEGRIAQSSGNAELDAKTLEQALANWKFKPATKGGKPVEDWVSIRVRFKLVE